MNPLKGLLEGCRVSYLLTFFYLWVFSTASWAIWLFVASFVVWVAIETLKEHFAPVLQKKGIVDVPGAFGVMKQSSGFILACSIQGVLQFISIILIAMTVYATPSYQAAILLLLNLGALTQMIVLLGIHFRLLWNWTAGVVSGMLVSKSH